MKLNTYGVGSNIVWIFPECFAAKTGVENFDRIQNETRPNLGHLSVFFDDLEISKPNAIFNYGESENVVEERLTFGVISWRGKRLIWTLVWLIYHEPIEQSISRQYLS